MIGSIGCCAGFSAGASILEQGFEVYQSILNRGTKRVHYYYYYYYYYDYYDYYYCHYCYYYCYCYCYYYCGWLRCSLTVDRVRIPVVS